MSLYKQPGSSNWWVRLSVAGRKTRCSTGTEDRKLAQEFEARESERLWRLHKLGDRSAVLWKTAAQKYLEDSTRPRKREREILAWLAPRLDTDALSLIDSDAIGEIRKDALAEGWSHSTVDRVMAVLRAVLRKCAREWGYLPVAPFVPMYKIEKEEPRWLTYEEFARLCAELPLHLELAARFAVETGLRMRSMLKLNWKRIDLKVAWLWVPGMQMKGGKPLGIPLSKHAIELLIRLKTLNPKGDRVFQYEGDPIDDCNTEAFQKAMERAKVEGANWHSLRHTFATWALADGLAIEEVMKLGGWKDYRSVLRYAHLIPSNLAAAAQKLGRNRA